MKMQYIRTITNAALTLAYNVTAMVVPIADKPLECGEFQAMVGHRR